MSFHTAASLRHDYSSWLARYGFNLAVTVNANRELHLHRQETIVRAIDGKLNRVFLGPRFSRLPEADRVGIVAVPETKLTSVHFHIALRIPVPVRSSILRSATKESIESLLRVERNGRRFLPWASVDVRVCDSGWLPYIVKSVTETTLVYVRGLPPADPSS